MSILTVSLTLLGFFVLYIAIKKLSDLKEQREAEADEDEEDPAREYAEDRASSDVELAPKVIEMGRLSVYPRCPACHEEITQVLIFWNNSQCRDTGEEYRQFDVQLTACGVCRTVLSGSNQFA